VRRRTAAERQIKDTEEPGVPPHARDNGRKLGIRSKAKMLENVRSLFRFFVNREFIAKSPVSADLKPPIGGAWRN
jgi:site-specific recombinase XerD